VNENSFTITEKVKQATNIYFVLNYSKLVIKTKIMPITFINLWKNVKKITLPYKRNLMRLPPKDRITP